MINLNPNIDLLNYYWFQNGFNDSEIEKINDLASLRETNKSTILGNIRDDSIRSSSNSWLEVSEDTNWLYEKFISFAKEANNVLWNFYLDSVIDSFQYTIYDSLNSGHYDWHLDLGPGVPRKISVVCFLDQKDVDYGGGDLQYLTGSIPKTFPSNKGAVVLFPSFWLHRVTPVTWGLRKTLVLWLGGSFLR